MADSRFHDITPSEYAVGRVENVEPEMGSNPFELACGFMINFIPMSVLTTSERWKMPKKKQKTRQLEEL
jgi:hypothetical protein